MQIDEKQMLKRLVLADASFFTTAEKLLLQKNLDSFNDLALMSVSEISSIIGRNLSRVKWNADSAIKKAKVSLHLLEKLGIGTTFFDFEDYPQMLKEMRDSPYALFYRGNLDCLKNTCVSVVGTRRATYTAKKAAFDFAKSACLCGETVVSGLAFGIDICAHRGAVSVKDGKTVAVLPSGIDTIVPYSHTKVASQIIEQGGLLLSEYTPSTPAMKFRFVQRNRIIAALSPATVVIQAPRGSGAMITVSLALDYNRYVFFSQVCFNEESKLLDAANEKKLDKQGFKNKMQNSPATYVEDGAPIVNDYEEYRYLMRQDSCEKKIVRHGEQRELFTD